MPTLRRGGILKTPKTLQPRLPLCAKSYVFHLTLDWYLMPFQAEGKEPNFSGIQRLVGNRLNVPNISALVLSTYGPMRSHPLLACNFRRCRRQTVLGFERKKFANTNCSAQRLALPRQTTVEKSRCGWGAEIGAAMETWVTLKCRNLTKLARTGAEQTQLDIFGPEVAVISSAGIL